jgi:hypothetical protein
MPERARLSVPKLAQLVQALFLRQACQQSMFITGYAKYTGHRIKNTQDGRAFVAFAPDHE